jgi:peptidoglycan/LPS O-acetylase OafA/YrhL
VHGLVIAHVYWIGEAVIKRKPALAIPVKLGLFVCVSVAVFLLAKLSFRFFEAPILRLKKRFD